MMKNKPFIFLIWVQNTETGMFHYFIEHASNTDEALFAIDRDNFDKVIHVWNTNIDETIMDLENKNIIFPREKIKIVKIRKFDADEKPEIMTRQLEQDGYGDYRNQI